MSVTSKSEDNEESEEEEEEEDISEYEVGPAFYSYNFFYLLGILVV